MDIIPKIQSSFVRNSMCVYDTCKRYYLNYNIIALAHPYVCSRNALYPNGDNTFLESMLIMS